jgi:hypothetical protein
MDRTLKCNQRKLLACNYLSLSVFMSESTNIYDTTVSPSLWSLLETSNLSNETSSTSLKSLVKWLEQFRWLANAHVVDFFTLNHWEKFDSTWREALLPSTLLTKTDCSTDCINTIYDDCIQLASYWNVKVNNNVSIIY